MKENRQFKGKFLDGNQEEFTGWYSRSVAVTAIVGCKFDDDILFLIEKRGPGCPDNIGKWVFPCGYVSWDESLREAASRELYEETGLKIDPSKFRFFGINDGVNENRQNITVRFAYISDDCEEFIEELFNKLVNTDTKSRGGEENECEEIKLMSGKEILMESEQTFAFGHEKLAKLILDNINKENYYWDSLCK